MRVRSRVVQSLKLAMDCCSFPHRLCSIAFQVIGTVKIHSFHSSIDIQLGLLKRHRRLKRQTKVGKCIIVLHSPTRTFVHNTTCTLNVPSHFHKHSPLLSDPFPKFYVSKIHCQHSHFLIFLKMYFRNPNCQLSHFSRSDLKISRNSNSSFC